MMHQMIMMWKVIFSLLYNFKINTATKPINYGPLAFIYNYKNFSHK